MGRHKTAENPLEKYYTDSELIDFIYKHSLNYIDESAITSFLEPASGAGAMIDYLNQTGKPVVAFDIYNETGREDITEADYLKTPIQYYTGRYTMMNPPFSKGIKFLHKAMKESDYVVAILAASSLINIDWSEVQKTHEVCKIQIKKKHQFDRVKADIGIIYLKRVAS